MKRSTIADALNDLDASEEAARAHDAAPPRSSGPAGEVEAEQQAHRRKAARLRAAVTADRESLISLLRCYFPELREKL
jgi:hypothetical protein